MRKNPIDNRPQHGHIVAMNGTQRVHVTLTKEQVEFLHQEVKRLGVTNLSELLRRIVDAYKEGAER